MAVVNVTVEGATCRLQLNRPAKLNALNQEVHAELNAALGDLTERPAVRVVVVSGEGRAFSAGADLEGGAIESAGAKLSWAERRHHMGSWQRLLDLLERIPQVTVASVHGYCIGGAALLAAACDLRIGAADLKVRIPELAIGIPLTWSGIPRLEREIGLPLARDLVMTGRTLGAEEALAAGFVQRLAPAAELASATESLVAELLAMPPGPLAMTRAAFGAISRHRLGAAAWADPDLLGWSLQDPEQPAAAAGATRAGETT